MSRRRKLLGRKSELEADPRLKDHGLFFSRAMLELPVPTEEEKAHAQRVLGEEDFALFDLFRQGTPAQRIEARNRLAQRHRGLIGKVIKRWAPSIRGARDSAVSFDDAWSFGTLALYHAIETFDYTYGFRFSTHAVRWIIATFMRELFPSIDGVRLPIHIQERIRRYVKIASQYDNEDDLRDALALTPDQFRKLQQTVRTFTVGNAFEALKRKMEEGGTGPDAWALLRRDREEGQGEELDRAAIKQMVSEAMARLNERERLVLSRRFGIGQDEEETLQGIAETVGITRERVRQIESKALKKLEKYLGVRRDQIL